MLRILLDTKDLIELVERSEPVSSRAFSEWLIARDGRAVLTYTNVSEFANCFHGVHDHQYIRSIIRALEALPVTYLHEALIEVSEIELAIDAFNAGHEPAPHLPYVTRWDETLAIRGEAAPGAGINDYPLDRMVFDLWQARDAEFEEQSRKLVGRAKQAIIDERAIPADRRLKPREALTRALEQKIAYWRLPAPVNMVAFGKWVFADASRCPGFRVAWQAFHAMVANVTDATEENDVWDNAHFPAVPYVDHVTFDRRMAGYGSEVCNRIAKQTPVADYRRRVHRSLAELLAKVA